MDYRKMEFKQVSLDYNMDLYIISLLKDSIYVVLHILGSGNIV